MFVKRKRLQKIKLRKAVKQELFQLYTRVGIHILLYIFVIFGALFVLNFIRLKLFEQGFFKVEVVKVKGLKYLKKEDVLAKIDILEYKDIFQVNKRSFQSRLSEFVEIKDIKLAKYYPNKIVIRIKEREPIFMTEVQGERFYIDEQGILLKYSQKLPLIFVPDELTGSLDHYRLVLELQKLFKKHFSDFFERIKEIAIDQNLLITLTLKNDKMLELITYDDYISFINTQDLIEVLELKIKFMEIVEEDLTMRKRSFTKISLKYFFAIDDLVVVA
ncbi:MAG: FtsQ-type POTRA domain-containing protein [bacterium]|nr:FtsQ-type POTRA domain-containing protein [bacterium]